MATRTEVNFIRLLGRCEAMAGDKKFDDWRLEKYVACLQDYLKDLHKATSKPTQETLTEYTRKVNFLKGLLETEKMPTAAEKVLAAELLAPPSQSANNSTPSRELHAQTKARYHKEIRDELFAKEEKEDTSGGVRQRKVAADSEQDIDTVLKHHHHMQEKIADEMVHLAKTMKENARTANKIVKDDTKKLTDSNKLAEKNFSKLEVESKRLESHVAKSCNWWIWIMLGAVVVTFVWMVVFMRLFPKR